MIPQTEPASVTPIYETRIAAEEALLSQLDRRSAQLANLRALTFLLGLGVGVAALFQKVPMWGFAVCGLFFAVYVLIAVRHGRVLQQEKRAALRRQLNRRGIARLSHAFHEFPNRGDVYLDANHVYVPDLDIFGHGSLFQLLDETGSTTGEATLASWLKTGATPKDIHSRQKALQELAPLLDFRQALATELKLNTLEKANPQGLFQWTEQIVPLSRIQWARAMPFVLPPLTLAVFLLLPGPWFWAVLLLQLAVLGLTQKTITQYYQTLEKGESGFTRFHEAFSTLERHVFVHPHLETLRKGLEFEGEFVSKRLARLSRLFAFVEVRQSGQMHGILNVALLWDLLFVFPLEAWRQKEGHRVRAWFSALAEFDALSAMATFTFEHPHYIFPTVEEGPVHFVAQKLGHPLLKAPVCNDVTLDTPHQAIIITGSNMSGKTTYLRTLGIAAVMAQAGLPVLAKSMKMSSLQVLTSMRVKDSLERGVSYFYAEVQRLKLLLDAVHLGNSLFLLDEILMGTNTAERQMASRDVLLQFLRQKAIGGVSTHDLALTQWPAVNDVSLRNVHFRDLLEEGQMTFDYLLQPGVVESTNAIKVMRLAGIKLSGIG